MCLARWLNGMFMCSLSISKVQLLVSGKDYLVRNKMRSMPRTNHRHFETRMKLAREGLDWRLQWKLMVVKEQ